MNGRPRDTHEKLLLMMGFMKATCLFEQMTLYMKLNTEKVSPNLPQMPFHSPPVDKHKGT